MFWSSVADGLKMLVYWETWAASVVFLIMLVVPMIAISFLANKNIGAGCLGMLLLPVFQVLATIMVIFTLLPIILGISNDAAWSLPWGMLAGEPWMMIRAALILTVLATVATFIPFIGRSATFTAMIIGSVAIAAAAQAFVHRAQPALQDRIAYLPPFLTGLGFLVIGGVVAFLATLAWAAMAAVLSRTHDEAPAPGPVAIAVLNVVGLIPAFMYGAWLGNQIQALS